MSDNLPTYLTYPDFGLLRLSGVDAEAFAQSQFANDVAALQPGQWHWSCWLTAKGRVLAVFALIRPEPGQLLLLLPDGRADTLAPALARYVFRRKVSVSVAEQLQVSCALQAPQRASGNQLGVLDDGSLELDMGGDGLPRSLRIGSVSHAASADADACLLWRQQDLQLGLVRLDDSQLESWTPQQLGLDRLGAYSVRKGCYPGQEIVARTHFLGKAKRATALLATTIAASSGATVQQGQRDVGQLVSVAGTQALAVMPLEPGDGELSVDGAAAHTLPLRAGLAR